MRILFLTPVLPRPARGGGTIKSATLLDYLTSRHHVDPEYLRRAEERDRRARSPLNLVRSYVAGVPLSILRNRSEAFAGRVRDRLSSARYDAVFTDSWLMAQYLPDDFRGLRALHQHNAEFLMWEREAALESNPVRRAVVRAEAGRVRRYESSILGRFDVVFAVSEPDRRALLALAGSSAPIELVPNVAEPGLLDLPKLTRATSEPAILYLGTLSWPPNARGLRVFVRHVLPLVRRRMPDARLIAAGRGASGELQRLVKGSAGAELVGAFEDPEPLYRRARAFVEVARGGSGTRVKVLNALARGLPVVTTPEGAQGIDARPGEHLLIGQTPTDLSEAVIRVLTDESLWSELSERGRALVRERYVPERAFGVLDRVFADPNPGA